MHKTDALTDLSNIYASFKIEIIEFNELNTESSELLVCQAKVFYRSVHLVYSCCPEPQQDLILAGGRQV